MATLIPHPNHQFFTPTLYMNVESKLSHIWSWWRVISWSPRCYISWPTYTIYYQSCHINNVHVWSRKLTISLNEVWKDVMRSFVELFKHAKKPRLILMNLESNEDRIECVIHNTTKIWKKMLLICKKIHCWNYIGSVYRFAWRDSGGASTKLVAWDSTCLIGCACK